jgi:hypothetical protein
MTAAPSAAPPSYAPPGRSLALVLVPALLLLAVALPGRARATTLRYQSVEALAADADAVVRARVARVGTRMQRTAAGLRPEREAELNVHEVLAGRAAPSLRVALHGGVHRGGERRVDGEARLREGDEVVLFLVRDGARWRVLGMSLGVWQVTGAGGGAQLARHVDDAVVLDDQGQARPVNETLTLSDLRAALARARRTP